LIKPLIGDCLLALLRHHRNELFSVAKKCAGELVPKVIANDGDRDGDDDPNHHQVIHDHAAASILFHLYDYIGGQGTLAKFT
jgi:hypothetical protein